MGQTQRAPDRESEREVKMWARFYDAFIAKSKLVHELISTQRGFIQVVTKCAINPIRVGRVCTFFKVNQHFKKREVRGGV